VVEFLLSSGFIEMGFSTGDQRRLYTGVNIFLCDKGRSNSGTLDMVSLWAYWHSNNTLVPALISSQALYTLFMFLVFFL